MSKLLKFITFFLALTLLAFWSPWQNWDFQWINLFGIESRQDYSSLNIKSFEGDLEVYIDNELQGTVGEDDGFLEISPLKEGEHTVRLQRPQSESDFFNVFERRLNFENNADVVIGYDLGPTSEFSEGHILSARKSFTVGKDPVLDIVSPLEGVNVKLDGSDIGKTPLRSIPISINSKHTLSFAKDGYDTLEIEIFPDSQEDRNKLKDLVLNLEVNLFLKPVDIAQGI